MGNYKTFTIAILAMATATAVLWQGLIDADMWFQTIGISCGVYLGRTVTDKIVNK